jgi:hypothetical protein
MRTLEVPKGYAVVVDACSPGCTWVVRRADGQALSGQALSGPAPDPDSARRRGAFAAGVLNALQRIGRRGF